MFRSCGWNVTRRVSSEYSAPTTANCPVATARRRLGADRIVATLSRTFAWTARGSSSSFDASDAVPITALTTGRTIPAIDGRRVVRRCAGFRSSSIACVTAPHPEWPRTTTRFAPKRLTANSMLSIGVGAATLPATRTEKISPIPQSNTRLVGTRASEQLKTTASGVTGSACSVSNGGGVTVNDPDAKRRLPARSLLMASVGLRCSVVVFMYVVLGTGGHLRLNANRQVCPPRTMHSRCSTFFPVALDISARS